MAASPFVEVPNDEQRRPLKDTEVTVERVIAEAPDTRTLVLSLGSESLNYEPGFFLTIDPHQFSALSRFIDYFEDLKHRTESPRAYSISSAPHETLAITVKEETYLTGVTKYPPLLSPVLVRSCPVGTRIQVTLHKGPYTLRPRVERHASHVVHICAGSGIVPNMSMIKHALHRKLGVRHTLFYGNRTWGDVIFRQELQRLVAQYPDHLRVIHALSREGGLPATGAEVHLGRVSKALMEKAITDPGTVLAYVCGPTISRHDRDAAEAYGFQPRPRFTELMCEALAQLGVPSDRICTESYDA
jgi:ferredoxin-NADP reductase